MELKKSAVPTVIGLVLGLLLFSPNVYAKLTGIMVLLALILIFGGELKEVFLNHAIDKTLALVFLAVLGAGFIIIDLSDIDTPLPLLWGAWLIIAVFLVIKTSMLATGLLFDLEEKDAQIKALKCQMMSDRWLLKKIATGNKWALEYVKKRIDGCDKIDSCESGAINA